MKKKLFFIIILLLCLFILHKETLSALKINEIYPVTENNNYEWIELYNDENKEINIENYFLLDLAGNKIKIPLSNITPFDFIIATTSSFLNNNGDTIYLKNDQNQIIEIATYSGKFDANKSFIKCPNGNGNWYISNIITKGFSNENACLSLTPTPTIIIPTNTPINTPIPTQDFTLTPTLIATQKISFDNIYLSEVMVNPPTGEKEWVEIYNNNDFEVNLDNWFIDDVENSGSAPKSFSLTIPAKEFVVVNLTNSMFNNDGDNVRLLDFDKNLKDGFEYNHSEKNLSWGRINFNDDNWCQQEPSKNQINKSCFDSNPDQITSIISKKTTSITKQISPTTKQELPKTKTLSKKSFFLNPTPTTTNILGVSDETDNYHSTSLFKTFSLISLINSTTSLISVFIKLGNKIKI